MIVMNDAGSNVFFANGGFDGWHALSVPRPPTHSVEVDMNATASHCADMAGDAGSAVVNAKQAAVVARWLTESYAGAALRRARSLWRCFLGAVTVQEGDMYTRHCVHFQ